MTIFFLSLCDKVRPCQLVPFLKFCCMLILLVNVSVDYELITRNKLIIDMDFIC